jgi:hypothetical protein
MFLGLMGLYVHAIFIEVKGRPNYIVESTFGFPEDSSMDALKRSNVAPGEGRRT